MNCINHNEQVAVGACQNCGVGLCGECVANGAKIENKPICKSCDLVRVDNAIAELSAELVNINIKKIIWTVIFLLGLGCFVYATRIAPEQFYTFYLGLIIWAMAGFIDRFQRQEEFNNSAAGVREAVKYEMSRKDAPMTTDIVNLLFYIAKVFLRGMFFPLVYAYFMIFGSMQIKKALKSWQDYKSNL